MSEGEAIIYLRTSTSEQNPEKQLGECEDHADKHGLSVVDTYIEEGSAWKDVRRPKYAEVRQRVKNEDIDAVIVWGFDRWMRNFKQLKDDMEMLQRHGVTLHSVKEEGLSQINQGGVLGDALQDIVFTLIGALAERESKRKSERVKMAHKAHSGDDWGRPSVKDKIREEVIARHEKGESQRSIADKVYYYDDNRNKKHPSKTTVQRIIKEYKDG